MNEKRDTVATEASSKKKIITYEDDRQKGVVNIFYVESMKKYNAEPDSHDRDNRDGS